MHTPAGHFFSVMCCSSSPLKCRIAFITDPEAVLPRPHTAAAFMAAIRDISVRKAEEEALFEEKERALITLNSIGDAVISTDISGNITFLNLVAEHTTGWSWQEAGGRPIAEVFRILDATSRETIPDAVVINIHDVMLAQMFAERIRMGDVTLGYQPHALAFNTWNGTGAPQAPENSLPSRWHARRASNCACSVPNVRRTRNTATPTR